MKRRKGIVDDVRVQCDGCKRVLSNGEEFLHEKEVTGKGYEWEDHFDWYYCEECGKVGGS